MCVYVTHVGKVCTFGCVHVVVDGRKAVFVKRSSPFVSEAHRALELLEDYHEKLTKPQDKQLRLAIERVIRIFKSRLFQALLGQSSTTSPLTTL
ncbi:hypothetical protein PR048_007197 [Dryococelus australis]|uniref:L27 domain-containing protein n=1 Tax=Dryococelus australis TaxID=614101 RepID=A0ABQ9ICY8_9NEOP|nr:hypothetical protein PR048_007197 [Dryococelus australis]